MNIKGIDLSRALSAAVTPSTISKNADFASLLNSKMMETTNLDSIFEEASKEYNIPVNLLKAVAKAESNFRADAKSSCGALGIMQLMPGTASSLGVSDPFDPQQNIMGGAKYLSGLLDQFDGDPSLALAAYNAGSGNVRKYNGIPPFAETQNYVNKVLGYCGGDITAGTIQTSAGGYSTFSPDVLAKLDNVDFDIERYTAALQIQLYQMQMQLNEPMKEQELL